jgi:hypothetical protein
MLQALLLYALTNGPNSLVGNCRYTVRQYNQGQPQEGAASCRNSSSAMPLIELECFPVCSTCCTPLDAVTCRKATRLMIYCRIITASVASRWGAG